MNTNPQIIPTHSFSQKLESQTPSRSQVDQSLPEIENHADSSQNKTDTLIQVTKISIFLLLPLVSAALIGIALVSFKQPQQNIAPNLDDGNLNSNLRELAVD